MTPDERAECRRTVRHFQHYTSEQRANHAASHRFGYQQRHRPGEHFWTHPDLPGVAFSTGVAAARAALAQRGSSREDQP